MCPDDYVLKEISTDGEVVVGVTSVGNELFVLLRRDVDQVAVYSMDDFQLLHHLNVPELKGNNSNDMTSCVQHKRLYMSNNDSDCIHKFHLSSSDVTKWSVPGTPRGLSVTPNCNLLVTCGGQTSKLVELSADSGQCVREIELQADIRNLWHAVQLTTGQFVVCHGDADNPLHRVCLVDDKGSVTRSYGGQRGSDVGQLNCPCHLALGYSGLHVYVADYCNRRVVLLNSMLEFVRYVNDELSYQQRLYLNPITCRLCVGQGYDGVIVILHR